MIIRQGRKSLIDLKVVVGAKQSDSCASRILLTRFDSQAKDVTLLTLPYVIKKLPNTHQFRRVSPSVIQKLPHPTGRAHPHVQ